MTFDDAVAGMDAAAAEAPQIMSNELAAEAQTSLGPIVEQWPVATGRSSEGFKAIRTLKGAAIVNPVDYSGNVGPGLAESLIPPTLAALDPQTIDTIERQLNAHLGE